MSAITRRDFTKKAVSAAGIFPFMTFPIEGISRATDTTKLSVHIFSKHLQFLDYRSTGEKAAELGFSGVDLTVRPGGHVTPESVVSDLPHAISEIKKGGSECTLITTRVSDAKNQVDINVLETAAQSGVKFYRMDWYKYPQGAEMAEALKMYAQKIKKLAAVNRKLGLVGCYQNHAGRSIGGSFWEVYEILKKADHMYFGAQYDIRHAMVEGGRSWENGFILLQPFIKTIVLKDYKWAKKNGKWKLVNTPIGEGMVDFDKYFKMLKEYHMNPSVSLHLEYPLGGAENGRKKILIDKKVVFDAMKKDLDTIQTIWASA
jgi:sugar phosphate isomerase/epimerase